jgi:hypothetical protein
VPFQMAARAGLSTGFSDNPVEARLSDGCTTTISPA